MNKEQKIMSNFVISEYKKVLMDTIPSSFPDLTMDEISEAIDYSILKRCKDGKAYIENNYEKTRINGTVLDVLNYINSCEPIITSSGVLFKKHKKAANPLAEVIIGFLNKRAGYKKQMYQYDKGTEEFAKYNLLQILEKLNANSVYGCLGNCNSMIYNLFVAEAVTRQGRSYISCSIMLFESLLANNVKFNNLDEIITFIHNVISETPKRMFDDSQILTENKTIEEVFYKVSNTIDMIIWMPTDKQLSLLWDYICTLSQEDLNRVYYKNNLYAFCDLPVITNLITNILKELEEPFINPNEPPEYIKEELDILVSFIKEYVYYPHFYIDKLDRVEYMQRDIVIICDTDSTIISFDTWFNFINSKIKSIPMKLKNRSYQLVDLINTNKNQEMAEYIPAEKDYDFYTDEIIEKRKPIEMCKIEPFNNLKYSIVNIIAYICSDLVVDYLNEYSKLTGSYEEGVKCRMIMKNEFYFLRALLTSHKRNYADYQLLQEGNIIPEKERMAIMGLPINKSSLSTDVKAKLQALCKEVLTMDKIDQVYIMKQLVLIEKEIYNSIMNKETKYYKPDNVGAINSYDDPLRINGIVAQLFYNEIRDDDMPEFNLNERNKVIKIKLNLSKKNVYLIKDSFPEMYDKLVKLLDHPILGAKLGTLGLPEDVSVPDWVLQFVDIQSIINDSLKNFPIESVGLQRLGNDNVNFSNVIQL